MGVLTNWGKGFTESEWRNGGRGASVSYPGQVNQPARTLPYGFTGKPDAMDSLAAQVTRNVLSASA